MNTYETIHFHGGKWRISDFPANVEVWPLASLPPVSGQHAENTRATNQGGFDFRLDLGSDLFLWKVFNFPCSILVLRRWLFLNLASGDFIKIVYFTFWARQLLCEIFPDIQNNNICVELIRLSNALLFLVGYKICLRMHFLFNVFLSNFSLKNNTLH